MEKVTKENVVKKKLITIKQIEKRLIPGSGETDCNVRLGFSMTIISMTEYVSYYRSLFITIIITVDL